jgi:carboxypeptidase family protein
MALGLGFAVLACEARPVPAGDYVFSVTGVVTTEGGAPIQGAEVTLEVNGPVYEGVTLVKAAKRLTNSTGGFVFTYLSHKRSMKYTVTVRKDSFEPQTVSAKAPPQRDHTIRLKRAGGGGNTPQRE